MNRRCGLDADIIRWNAMTYFVEVRLNDHNFPSSPSIYDYCIADIETYVYAPQLDMCANSHTQC